MVTVIALNIISRDSSVFNNKARPPKAPDRNRDRLLLTLLFVLEEEEVSSPLLLFAIVKFWATVFHSF